jgi:hypothetical protein
MRRAVVVIVLGLSLVFVGITVAIGGGLAPMSISPSQGPPGTVIEVESDFPCLIGGDGEIVGTGLGQIIGEVQLGLFDESDNLVASGTVQMNEDGTWTGSITVPEGTPPGLYLVRAECTIKGQVVFEYDPQRFTVTGPEPEPEPEPTEEPEVPTPVEAEPTFTG